MLHKETIEFTWDFPEFEFKEKTKKWYWLVGIVAVILIVLAIILKNYLFAFLILLGGFLMFSLSTKEPFIIPVEISEYGIKVHDVMYPYKDIIYFWIGKNKNEEPLLLLSTNRRINPLISVPIDIRINIMQLREYLDQFIEEQELREPFTDRIIEKIGF